MTYIVSSDLDMLQIVDENTKMYRILRGFSDLEEMDIPAIEEKYGIKEVDPEEEKERKLQLESDIEKQIRESIEAMQGNE